MEADLAATTTWADYPPLATCWTPSTTTSDKGKYNK